MTRWLVALVLIGACGRSDGSNEGKRMPKSPPPPQPALPTNLTIAVEIDGQPATAIDAARLAATQPTFEEEGKRAWRLDTLIGEAATREGAVMRVTGARGMQVVLTPPRSPTDPVPVLAANLRGDVVAAMVESNDPFPAYHGQGGRLGRPGDPLPRMTGVTRISVSVEK